MTYAVKIWKPGGEIDRDPDLISKGFAHHELAIQAAIMLIKDFYGQNADYTIDGSDIWAGNDFETIAAKVYKEKDHSINEPIRPDSYVIGDPENVYRPKPPLSDSPATDDTNTIRLLEIASQRATSLYIAIHAESGRFDSELYKAILKSTYESLAELFPRPMRLELSVVEMDVFTEKANRNFGRFTPVIPPAFPPDSPDEQQKQA